MGYSDILAERDESVGVITLDRPEVLNALTRDLLRELDDALSQFLEDPQVGVIVVTGSGDAFSAGADLDEMARLEEDAGSNSANPDHSEYFWRIAACTKPNIGAINGLAYGGGAMMASSFDMRVGGEKTTFRFLGAASGADSTWSLPMQVGWPVAKELLFTSRIVDAREAYRIGLLNHLVASDQVVLKAIEVAKQIAANDSGMVQGIKDLMVGHVGSPWDQMFRREREVQRDGPDPR